MKKTFTLLFVLVIAINAINSKTLSIYPTTGQVALDGYADEDAWNACPSFISMDVTKSGTETYKNNVAKFKIMYDAKNLYVYAEIFDATLDTSYSMNSWEKDCLEVFVSLDTLSQAYSTDGYNASFQFRKVFGRAIENDGYPTRRGIIVEEAEIAGGRTQEWLIPFDSLATQIKDPLKWDKKNFRFEIQNGDNDGSGRQSQLFWNSAADDQYNNTTHMGYAILSGTPAPQDPGYTQKSISIEKTNEKITIDGNSTENTWNNDLYAKWNNVTENKGQSSYKNNTVRYKMAYDNDFVYVLVEVKDAALDVTQYSDLTQRDGIELCFSMDTTTSSTYRAGDSKILKVYNKAFSDPKGYEVKETIITGGYQQEWKLSWESLAGKSNFSKKNFKFELINNDNDYYGRNSQLFWNSNIGDQESNNKHFGLVNINNKVSASVPKTLVINKTNDTITIDGKAIENIWSIVSWNNLLINVGDVADKNNTARFKMIYDDENIYVLAEIKDALIDTAQSKNLCEKDGVELFFGMDTLNSNYPKKGDNYLRKVYGLNFVDQYSKGYEVKEAVISGGFRQEWKLPIMSLIGSGNYNDKNFRFDMKNNDNDGLGRVSQLNWSSKTSSWPGVANQGYVTFGSLLVYTSVSSNIQESLMSFNSNMIEFKQPSNYTIYNIVGKVVMLGNNANSVNISSLPKGIYVISANNENKKFIK
jgi:hypothetical protein